MTRSFEELKPRPDIEMQDPSGRIIPDGDSEGNIPYARQIDAALALASKTNASSFERAIRVLLGQGIIEETKMGRSLMSAIVGQILNDPTPGELPAKRTSARDIKRYLVPLPEVLNQIANTEENATIKQGLVTIADGIRGQDRFLTAKLLVEMYRYTLHQCEIPPYRNYRFCQKVAEHLIPELSDIRSDHVTLEFLGNLQNYGLMEFLNLSPALSYFYSRDAQLVGSEYEH